MSIDSIVTNRTCRVVFLFNYYDCGSCIDSGFSITKKIDSLYSDNKVIIISTMGSPYHSSNVTNIMNIYTLIQKI